MRLAGARLVDMVVAPRALVEAAGRLRLHAGYYITKQIIPALERVLHLVGADPRAWFHAMARPQRLLPHKRPPAPLAAAATASTSGPAGTIDQYYLSRHCAVGPCSRSPNRSSCRRLPNSTDKRGPSVRFFSKGIERCTIYAPRHFKNTDQSACEYGMLRRNIGCRQVCDALTHAAQPLCEDCRCNPQLATAALCARAGRLERHHAAIVRVCLHCGGGGARLTPPPGGSVACDSLDCGLYFERRKAAHELAAALAFQEAGLESLEGGAV